MCSITFRMSPDWYWTTMEKSSHDALRTFHDVSPSSWRGPSSHSSPAASSPPSSSKPSSPPPNSSSLSFDASLSGATRGERQRC
jgi:hypothetical protein